MHIPETILALLQCPTDAGELGLREDAVVCLQCGAEYRVAEGYVDFGDPAADETEQELLDYYEDDYRGHEDWASSWKAGEVLKLLGQRQRDVILDAGCGTTTVLRQVAEGLGAQQLIGVDWSRPGLKKALAKEVPPAPLALLRANVNSLPVRSDALDLLLAVDLLEHLPAPQGFLAEARRVAGEIVVKVPLGGRRRPWRRAFGHLRTFSLRGTRVLMEESGWELIAESFPDNPILRAKGEAGLLGDLRLARKNLNRVLRRILRRPKWYLAHARRAG